MADPVVVGSGLTTGGAVLGDPLGPGEEVGVPEPLGVADGLTDGVRDGDLDGLGDVSVGLGDGVGVEVGYAVDGPVSARSGPGPGRNRKYSASTATNRPEMIRVEVRGRPLMRRPRWPGRCQGRPRR